MGAMKSQITSLTIVYSTVYSGADHIKKTSKLRVSDLCEGNSPVTGDFTAQRASNAETVSIWWRHHAKLNKCGPHWGLFGYAFYLRQMQIHCGDGKFIINDDEG